MKQDAARRRRPTLADIAESAGVSVNTVSRALRAPQTVRPELRRKIEEFADELHYLPNRLAGGLAGGRIPVVGVVITSLFYSEFAGTIDALQEELSASGLNVMLGNSRYDQDEERRLVKAIMSWRPAALALVGVDHDDEVKALLARAEFPVIEIWDFHARPIDIAIGMDHEEIGRAQARHLLEKRYRKLAFVGALRDNDFRAKKRYRGFASELAEVGHGQPALVSRAVGGTTAIGAELAHRLISMHPEVDAIATNSDVVAFGVLKALREAGRVVPTDVGVIAFGDTEAAAAMTPELSSIRPPRAEIGRAAAQAILARIDGGHAESVRFDAVLMSRQSSAGRNAAV